MASAFAIESQPLLGVSLDEQGEVQAHFEIRTRTTPSKQRAGEFEAAPISIYLILRKYGAPTDINELPAILKQLTSTGEELLEQRVIPHLLTPIREAVSNEGGSDFENPQQD